MDWNGDGKHDWRDDALFNNVIDSNNSSSKNRYNGSNSSSGMEWVAILFILAIISFFF